MSDRGHHITRPRVVGRLVDARRALAVAPGGFGKSVLAGHLADRLGVTPTIVDLEAGSGLDRLLAGIAAALSRSGAADLADAVGSAPLDEAAGALASGLGARAELILLCVDDCHHLDATAWAWLMGVADGLPAPHRILLLTRDLPPDVAVADGWALVGATDLRFDAEEVRRLVGTSRISADDVLALTEGWPAAVALTRNRLAEGPARPLRRREGQSVLAALIEELLAGLPAALGASLATCARLPLLSPDLVDELCGAGTFNALRVGGLPLTEREDGWFEIADPLREAIAAPPLGDATAATAARYYADVGDLSLALAVLEDAAGRDAFVPVLAERPWLELDDLGLAAVRATLDVLGPERVRRHPELAIKAAWVAELRDPLLRTRWLTLAQDATESPSLVAMIKAELARDAARVGKIDDAERLAVEALNGATDDAIVTRARALLALGQVNTTRCTPAALSQARTQLEQAILLFRLARERRWEADALLRLGYTVSFHGGRCFDAATELAQVLAIHGAPDRQRAIVLTHYADVLDILGRVGEAEAAVEEALTIGRRLGDELVLWYGAWAMMLVAAHQGDLPSTHRWIAEAERHAGHWLDQPQGTEFGFGVNEALHLVGADEEAATRWPALVERAREQGLEDALGPAAARHEAYIGDPAVAERILVEIEGAPWAVERSRWVRRLLRALAAHRSGDAERAHQLVAEAHLEADRMGLPDLPARHEARLLDALADYRVADQAPVAGRRLSLLGSFRLSAGAEDVSPQPGHPALVVKLLALRGPTPVEALTDLLWPEADEATGRARLRNLLNRLRNRSGDVVIRTGDLVALAPDIVVDLHAFESLAGQAESAPPHQRVGAARLAVAAYGGELLPGDRYEEWAVAPRERLIQRYVGLREILADDAIARGDRDDAVRQLEAAFDVDPYDETPLVRAAELLLAEGARLAARRMVTRAERTIADMGLVPDGRLAALAAELAANGR